MIIIAVDLGTTNVKVAAYSEDLKRLALIGKRVSYSQEGGRVEFDAEHYFDIVFDMICQVSEAAIPFGGLEHIQIVLTGQAESLVLLEENMHPVCKGISWMDMRAEAESHVIETRFEQKKSYRITGESSSSPTWPAAKLLWFRTHTPEIVEKVKYVLLLKDYLQYRLTGIVVGEESIRGFTYFFDINQRIYWSEMLDFCGFTEKQLPPTVPVGYVLGEVRQELRKKIPKSMRVTVNVGILDHFAGAIGMGVAESGILGESAGTVLSLTGWAKKPDYTIETSWHCGTAADEYMLFSCCDNGGISYDWFKEKFIGDLTIAEVERSLYGRTKQPELLFFPYISGTNAPDFRIREKGIFTGINYSQDRIDFVRAVMESSGYLLRRNIEKIRASGIAVKKLKSTGGGTKSAFWCQMKADICRIPIEVPEETELVCRGAAILGLISAGVYSSAAEAASLHQLTGRIYLPCTLESYEEKFERFQQILKALESGVL